MIRLIICFCAFPLLLQPEARAQTGAELLAKTIAYHDPDGVWPTFQQELFFETDMPDGSVRSSQVKIDNATGTFEYQNPDRSFGIKMDSCYHISGEVRECDRIARTRNYYVYLWGLPMKLMDEGTDLDEEVYSEQIEDKAYQVLKVTYPDDIWYFYINPETYAMEAYKFYKDEPNQKGEIIYLDGEMEVAGMKIPVARAWYRTENDEYLATDKLVKTVSLEDSNLLRK
ncbi:MAG: DUF6503 family protein [Bacteroidota bacterium]